ncbi:hypothetical protein CERZMDRAFT_91097 [Cercospora zeae-maydis SCOH1-5]|uniref:Uncharacterized protein n=1 Tax=Cercospora zeae-maydis SCOH1-5 TaxID=717836 RepID=A0A6A6FAZ6_9PEZI|nr:hypothetical protein CERZMDRAFT_91097 [Cercospora zeae-maydis SCOH1-5]
MREQKRPRSLERLHKPTHSGLANPTSLTTSCSTAYALIRRRCNQPASQEAQLASFPMSNDISSGAYPGLDALARTLEMADWAERAKNASRKWRSCAGENRLQEHLYEIGTVPIWVLLDSQSSLVTAEVAAAQMGMRVLVLKCPTCPRHSSFRNPTRNARHA